MNITIEFGRLMVINDSNDTLVLEEVKYGAIFAGDTEWIYPGNSTTAEGVRVHYFFDNEPPDEIHIDSDSDEEIRWWPRKKR